MLHEYAFTPHVFDANRNPDEGVWRESIRQLARILWPNPKVACPIVISGLHGDGTNCTWSHMAALIMNSIPDANVKREAGDVLKQMREHLVIRPAELDWPGEDEDGWIDEATKSHASSPLKFILGSGATAASSSGPVHQLDHVLAPGTMTRLPQSVTPTGSIEAQASLLRPLLIHADMLRLSMPYASTRDFTCAVIRTAFARPANYALPEIEVISARPVNLDTLIHNMREMLPGIAGNGRVHWNFWDNRDRPEYRERIILAYAREDIGEASPAYVPKWGVAMTHVPGEGDPKTAEPTTWTLLSTESVALHDEKLMAAANAHARDSRLA